MDEAVRRWKQTGRVWFWHEPDRRQGDGWHIAADAAGCDDLERIVGLAREGLHPARFTFAAAPGARALTISFDRHRAKDHWSLTKGEPMHLALGPDGLDELSRLAAALRAGEGDYTIGPHDPDQRIWVWWPPR